MPEPTRTGALLVGGTVRRARPGATLPVTGPDGTPLGRVAHAGPDDVAAAVAAARAASAGWAGTRALDRGRALLRVADALAGHRDRLAADVAAAEGSDHGRALVDRAVELLVRFAGWADKLPGAAHPGAGPVVGWSAPRPLGVVAVLAPARSSLVGFLDAVAPALCAGNTVVAVASDERPLPAVTVAEVLATADLPAGVLTVLTGPAAELGPALAGAPGVDALAVHVSAGDGAAADGPAADGPAADAPAVDGPAADGPAVDAPAVDGPAADGPAADGPLADLERAAAGPGTRLLAVRPDAPDPVRLRAVVDLVGVRHPAGP